MSPYFMMCLAMNFYAAGIALIYETRPEVAMMLFAAICGMD